MRARLETLNRLACHGLARRLCGSESNATKPVSLLLGLCVVASVASEVLTSLSVSRDVVLARLPPASQLHAPGERGQLPFSRRAKLALERAAQRPNSRVEPEQVLLALLRDTASTAALILADRSVDATVAEREIVRRQTGE